MGTRKFGYVGDLCHSTWLVLAGAGAGARAADDAARATAATCRSQIHSRIAFMGAYYAMLALLRSKTCILSLILVPPLHVH